jgi:D-amino-acid dehydrogenase
LKSLFDPLSPLYVAPRPDPVLAKWLWAFSRTCNERHLHLSMGTLATLGHVSRRLFDELMETEKLECSFRPDGYYEIFLTAGALVSETRDIASMPGFGFHPQVVTGPALRECEPAINEQVLGGIFHPEAATANPHALVLEMAKRAQAYGVKFRAGSDVATFRVKDRKLRGVRMQSGEIVEADSVVLAAGAYSGALMRGLGIRLPLQAGKGYHRDCEPAEGRPTVLHRACRLAENMVFCTPMNGFVRFAGTLEFSGVNHDIRRPRLEQLTNASRRYLTTMDNPIIRSEWCGLRPCLPDGLPAVGQVPSLSGLLIATGHAMAGLTLGPVTGKLISECILDGSPSIDITPLRPDRF